jgi:uncharacterized protein YeaO (DUF488 family)
VTLPLSTRRWNDAPVRGEGVRVLVCRYRPRGVKKEDETWDEWWKELGPSVELHAAFWGKTGPPIGWEEYRKRYLAEIAGRKELLERLGARLAKGERIALLCSSACTDAKRCHRTLLVPLIDEAARHLDS